MLPTTAACVSTLLAIARLQLPVKRPKGAADHHAKRGADRSLQVPPECLRPARGDSTGSSFNSERQLFQ